MITMDNSSNPQIDKAIPKISQANSIYVSVLKEKPYCDMNDTERERHSFAIKERVLKRFRSYHIPQYVEKICNSPVKWWSIAISAVLDLGTIGNETNVPVVTYEYEIICPCNPTLETTFNRDKKIEDITEIAQEFNIPDDIFYIPMFTLKRIENLLWVYKKQGNYIAFCSNPVTNSLIQFSGTLDKSLLQEVGTDTYLRVRGYGELRLKDKGKEEFIELFRTPECGRLIVFVFGKYLSNPGNVVNFTAKEYAEWLKSYKLQYVREKLVKNLTALENTHIPLEAFNNDKDTMVEANPQLWTVIKEKNKKGYTGEFAVTINYTVAKVISQYINNSIMVSIKVGELTDRQWELYWELLLNKAVHKNNSALCIPISTLIKYVAYKKYADIEEKRRWRQFILHPLEKDLDALQSLDLITYTHLPQFDSYGSFVKSLLSYNTELVRYKELQE